MKILPEFVFLQNKQPNLSLPEEHRDVPPEGHRDGVPCGDDIPEEHRDEVPGEHQNGVLKISLSGICFGMVKC